MALIAAAALVALVAILIAADFAAHQGRIHNGVRVWSQDLSGMTAAQASERLASQASAWLKVSRRLVGTRPGGDWDSSLVPDEAGIGFDVQGTVEAALDQGRSGGAFASVFERLSLWLSARDLDPRLTVDTSAWESTCDNLAVEVERLPRDATFAMEGSQLKVVPAERGVAIDRETLRSRLLASIATSTPNVECPLVDVAPFVSTEEASTALDAARQFFSGPIQIRYQDSSVQVSREDLLHIAGFPPEGIVSGRPVTVNTERGREVLAGKLAAFEKPAIDAQVLPSAGGASYRVIPSQDGIAIEWEQLFAAIDRLALQRDQQYVPLPVIVSHPRLTTLDAELLKNRSPVASFTTYFSPANTARVNNIKQVAELLDDRVIQAGETFSFNGVVGPRTKAAGFDEAPVISNGVLTQGVGGGICQVSTTLFNTALLAGLPIVERAPHSFYIERYPIGRDATVSYGEQDLKFRNDTENLLIINAEAGDSYVRVTFSAAKWDRYGICDDAQVTGVKPPSSSQEKPRIYRDPDMAAGETSAVEAGIDGRTVELQRHVYSSDGKLLFEDTFRSEYSAKDWLVRVGG